MSPAITVSPPPGSGFSGGGVAPVQPWDVGVGEMLPTAEALKQHADALLASGNYPAAEHTYDHALRFVEVRRVIPSQHPRRRVTPR